MKQISYMKFCLANSDKSYNLSHFLKSYHKYIVDQGIGLNGKNGNIIFENDRVTDGKNIYEVFWHHIGYEFLEVEEGVPIYREVHIEDGYYEVIGNTHV